jgi:hypothetical protein
MISYIKKNGEAKFGIFTCHTGKGYETVIVPVVDFFYHGFSWYEYCQVKALKTWQFKHWWQEPIYHFKAKKLCAKLNNSN